MIIALRILLFILISAAAYIALRQLQDIKIDKLLQNNINKINKITEKKIIELKYKQYFKNAKRNRNLLIKYELLIQGSNIRKYMPIMRSEILILISIIISSLTFYISYKILFNIIASIIIAAFMFMSPKYILDIIIYHNSSNLDNSLLPFVNMLRNYCEINDDIVYAIENSTEYVQEPLKSFNKQFLNEVKHGIMLEDCLENYASKIDNKSFKQFFKNIKLCTKGNGSYINVMNKYIDLLYGMSEEKIKRKQETRDGKLNIFMISLIGVAISYGCYVIDPNLLFMLKRDFAGQLLTAYFILVYIMTIYKVLTLERFKY